MTCACPVSLGFFCILEELDEFADGFPWAGLANPAEFIVFNFGHDVVAESKKALELLC